MDKKRLLVYLTVFLTTGLSTAVVPVLPEIAAVGHGGRGALSASLLFSGYYIGALLTMIPFGMLSDRYDHLKLVLLSILLNLASGLMLLLSDSITILVAARLAGGLACGAFFPVAYVILADYDARSRYLGEFNFLLNAGLASGAALAGYMAAWHIRGSILLFTILAALNLLIFIVVPDRTPKKVRVKTWDKEKVTILGIAGHFVNSSYIRIWVISFLIFGISGLLNSHYANYSQDTLSKTMLGLAIAAMYMSAMFTNIIVGRLGIHYSSLIRAGVTAAACGMLLTFLQPLAGFALIGMGSGLAMLGLPVAVANTNIDRGLAMGMFNTSTYAGMGLMPLIAGLFISSIGFEKVMVACAIIVLSSLLFKDKLPMKKSES